MSKEAKHRREERKKPTATLKERRAKKHEKKIHKDAHIVSTSLESS